ncbi:KV6A7 protein, partial [Atlantisia rogersi]|nr:KV6A7 protein [Atlantisia rogersi]
TAETPTQSCSPRAGGVSAQVGWVQQSPGQLRVLPGDTAEMNCCSSLYDSNVHWYREKPDGSLERIYRSRPQSIPKGRYSGGMKPDQTRFLTISPAQREDSGVYYCSSSGINPVFGSGTRLVVSSECHPAAGDIPGEVCVPPHTPCPFSDATEPQLSILVPVGTEEAGQPPATFPLLCHLHDIPAGWDTVRWQPGGDVTPVMAAAVDEHGVLSAWSITWVSAEHW